MDDKHNPPAFACAAGTPDNGDWQSGMTLRDYFAAAALQALIPLGEKRMVNDLGWGGRAYQIADEMLKARQP